MRKIQVQSLEAWARENGLILNGEQLPPLIERTNEHLVAFREVDQRWVKATKPGYFAYIADTEYSLDKHSQQWVGKIFLREALPSEYLARLRLHNEVFADAIRFEGVLISKGKLSVVSSQPDISGSPSTLAEIAEAMKEMGFDEVKELHLGYTASLSFFRKSDNIAVFDAHPANAVTSAGLVVPVDFIIQLATDSMAAELGK